MIAAEAATWKGTPFRWGQSVKGVGCDGKGLVQGVARELGFPEAETFYAKVSHYRDDRPVPYALLKEGMAAVFDRADTIQPGDVLLLKEMGKAQHLAIAISETRLVHARGKGDKEWVAENRIASLLKLCPLDSVWRWRD
jgi:cell wall-associated NlpC family hydrolase